MKALLSYFIFLFVFVFSAHAQIKGVVVNKRAQPIAGASISVLNSYDGAVSDSLGRFSFEHIFESNDSIEVSSIGYNTIKRAISKTDNLPIKIVMTETISEMQAVVIRSAGAFLSGNNKKGVVVSSLDIVTMSQNGDITNALKMLPGAQQIGEQEGLFVRGGTANETKQFMDGAVISNPYFRGPQNLAQRGRYNPFLFSGTLFSTGGYSALYGDALSSVVLLNTIDLPERSEFQFTLSPIMLQAGTQQLSKKKTASFGANYTITAVAPYFGILKPKVDFYEGPTYHVADANFRTKTKGGIVKAFFSFNQNHIAIREPDIENNIYNDDTKVGNFNAYSNLNWQENLGNKWKLNWSNSFSVNKDNIGIKVADLNNHSVHFPDQLFWMQAKSMELKDQKTDGETRLVFEKRLAHLDALRIGADYHYLKNQIAFNQKPFQFTNHTPNTFAELDHYFSNNLATTIGLRAGYSSINKKYHLAPRFSLVYKVGTNQQVSGAYGIFYQQPEPRYLLQNANLKLSRASHYILNYTWLTPLRIFRAEAFYKDYKDLFTSKPNGFENISYANGGKGYAKGIDVFWKDKMTLSGFEYWISYSYLNTKRKYLEYTDLLQPSFATPHTASIVLKRFLLPIKTQFNLTYSFATGRPYYYFQQKQNTYTLLDKGKTPTYNNVGFSINYVPFVGNEKKKTRIILVATVSNLLATNQVFGYRYSYDGSKKIPIKPASKQFFFIGLFLNIGTDRTQQIINDNL